MAKIGKILTIIMWVLLLISGILVISMVTNINPDNLQDPVLGAWINTCLTWAYILLAVSIVIILLFGVYSMVTEKKALKSGLLILAFFVVIVGISYLISTDKMPQFSGVNTFIENGQLTPKISRMISVGLNTTYILFFLAIASIVWSSVSRLFK